MEWTTVDHAMRQLSRRKASCDAEEATWLLEAARVHVWTHVGLGSLTEYLERVFGYTPRQVEERMRVAIALDSLPRMHRALAAGELSWSAVRELTRVANTETEAAWIDAARTKTVREVEEMVAGREDGDNPDDPRGPVVPSHHVHYEVIVWSGNNRGTFRECLADRLTVEDSAPRVTCHPPPTLRVYPPVTLPRALNSTASARRRISWTLATSGVSRATASPIPSG